MCEDQEIGVGLSLWCKILQGGGKKKARASSAKGFKVRTKP